MPRSLPENPSLEYLRKEAKLLLREAREGQAAARARLESTGAPGLADAQRAIAREYGFASWTRLKTHIASLESSADITPAFVQAVAKNDVAVVRDLLARHPSLTARLNDTMPGFDFGATPLLAALHHHNTELLQLLLDAGADINQRSHWWAGGFGVLDDDGDLASWFIARGAVVDAHAAARLGMLDTLRTLVGANPALVHARGGDGQTPLHFASTIEVADFLLSAGANIDAQCVDHESTPAQWMIRDRTIIAHWLVERGARADLFVATALGDVDRVRTWLDASPEWIRASINNQWFPRRNPHAAQTILFWTLGGNKTPHRVARDFGREDVLSLLMERSPDDLRLAVACELEDDAMLDALLADPSRRSTLPDDQLVKLVWAAEKNDAKAVQRLLRAGWPVSAHNNSGVTALHFACWHGNTEMVRELLQAGASLDVREQNYAGTPVDWLTHGEQNSWYRERGDYPAVKALVETAAGRT